MKTKKFVGVVTVVVLLSTLNPQLFASPIGTAFTYQGKLSSGTNAANGVYDFNFALYDVDSGGAQIRNIPTNAVPVTDGYFLVTLDFGNVFRGDARWLEISVKTNGAGGYTTLTPRQPLTPAPYAIMANNASNVLGTVPAAQLSGTVANGQLASNSITVNAGPGLGGGGTVVLGGATTLTNTGVLSITGNVDITATPAAGYVTLGSTATETNLASRIVKRDGSGDFSAGSVTLAGNLVLPGTTSANGGAIYADSNLLLHQYGFLNFFAGLGAGNLAVIGGGNVGIGAYALTVNKFGGGNTASGYEALYVNTNGALNTALGYQTLYANTSGNYNIAIGAQAGYNLTTGSSNIDIGNPGVAGESRTIRLGAPGGQTNTFIAGIYSNTVPAGLPVYVEATGRLGTGAGSPVALLNSNETFTGAVTFNNPASSFSGTFTGNGAGLTNLNAAQIHAWSITGNAGTSPSLNFLGTTDNQPLELKVNSIRALWLEAFALPGYTGIVNLVGGYGGNSIAPGVGGSVIGGGGFFYDGSQGGTPGPHPNSVSASLSFLGGGSDNSIQPGANGSFLGGGYNNSIQTNAGESFLGGGHNNLIRTNAIGSFLGGGVANSIETDAGYAFVGGGCFNTNSAANSVVVGGENNRIGTNADHAVISGGKTNWIGSYSGYTIISGGKNNSIGPFGAFAAISGGVVNSIGDYAALSVISGGGDNTIGQGAVCGAISGGEHNNIGNDAYWAVISGGRNNSVGTNAHHAIVCGGETNTIGPNAGYAVISGGGENVIDSNARYSTIGGGGANTIQTDAGASTIGGGWGNTIQDGLPARLLPHCSTISGGDENTIRTYAYDSTIGGGYKNTIEESAGCSTIGGGWTNTIQTNAYCSVIGGGYNNTIQTNARYATIPGGCSNSAASYAFAAGQRAKATNQGTFVWADSRPFDFEPYSMSQGGCVDSFNVRATGGIYFVTGVDGTGHQTTGPYCGPGDGSFTAYSDRNAKENFAVTDVRDILARVVALPIETWNYKAQGASIRHIGPMAQDFKAAFNMGATDKGISTVDADGVALAAIQGLNQKLKEKDAEIQDLKARMERLEKLISSSSGRQ